MVKWPWKRKNELLTAVKDLTQGVHSGFSLLAKKIDEIEPGFEPETTISSGNTASTPGEVIPLQEPKITQTWDILLGKIDARLAQESDPDKVDDLLETRKKIRMQKARELNAVNYAREKRRHPERYQRQEEERYPDEIIQRDGTVLEREDTTPGELVDEIAGRVGITKTGKLDPAEFSTKLRELVKENPKLIDRAKFGLRFFGVDLDSILSKFGANSVEEGLDMMDQLIKSGHGQELAAKIGDQASVFLKETVKPRVQEWASKGQSLPPQATAQPNGEVVGQTINIPPIPIKMVNGLPVNGYDGFRLFRHPLGLVDPRRPYQTSQMGPVGQVM